MKIMICVPCMDTLDTDFVKSLLNIKSKHTISINLSESSLVYASRQRLVEEAVNTDADYVMWIDSDMVFTSDMIDRLVDDNKDIVTGICHMRRPPYSPAIWKSLKFGFTPEETIVENYDEYPENSLFSVDACGAAFMLVKIEVFKKMLVEMKHTFFPILGYGEDVSFCIRARKLGYKIFCDSRVKIGHKAQTLVTEYTYKAFKERNSNE